VAIKTFWKTVGSRGNPLIQKLNDLSERFMLCASIAPPISCYIELSSVCNLQCPLCPTGLRILGRPYKFMDWDTFKIVVDDLGVFGPSASLNMWGESLFHPHFFEMVRYAKSRGLGFLTVNTSCNIDRPDAWFKELASCGLQAVMTDVDGADAETYSKYRKGGNFNLVIDFLRKLSSAKKQLNSPLPQITPLVVVSRYNQDQLEEIRQMLEPFGIDGFQTRNIGVLGMPPEAETKVFADFAQTKYPAENPQAINEQGRLSFLPQTPSPRRLACLSLWKILHVNAEGNYVPCCKEYSNDTVLGNVFDTPPIDFWFSKKLADFRRKNLDDPASIPLCRKCYFIQSVRGISEPSLTPIKDIESLA
jgi:radical SAM protein with 4Fe4S-binding SPASM domain